VFKPGRGRWVRVSIGWLFDFFPFCDDVVHERGAVMGGQDLMNADVELWQEHKVDAEDEGGNGEEEDAEPFGSGPATDRGASGIAVRRKDDGAGRESDGWRSVANEEPANGR